MKEAMRNKLISLIRCADFHPVKGTVRTVGSQFCSGIIEDIADHLLANGVAVRQWIPVTERLPKSGVKVLVSVRGRDESLIGWYDADWEDWIVEEDLSEKKFLPVTHWQEKPKPAKEG